MCPDGKLRGRVARRTSALILGLAVFALPGPLAAQVLPPASRWIPADAVLALELAQPAALIQALADDKATAALKALPAWSKLQASPGFMTLRGGIRYCEHLLERDWRSALAKLLGGGVTLAVCPKGVVLLIVDAADEKLLREAHEILLDLSGADEEDPAKEGPSRLYKGTMVWSFGGKDAHAIIGRRLIMANRREGLEAMLDLRARPEGASLATQPGFQRTWHAAGSDAVARGFVNLEPLLKLPRVARALKQQRLNPLAALTFAAGVEALRKSSYLSLSLVVKNRTFVINVQVDGEVDAASGLAAFSVPDKPGEGVLPSLQVPRRIGALSFYRDLRGFYAAKDELFPERTSALIFFENMMGIFFTGRDLTDEVLAQTEPHIRIVVAEQKYDPGIGTPRVQLPAFAAVLKLRDAATFDDVVEEAWQKAVGMINFTRGQQALPGLIIDRATHRDTKYTLARFSVSGEDDRKNLDQRFNFRPTLAMPGDHLILSSTEGLARDLIDTLSRERKAGVAPRTGIHSSLRIEGNALVAILRANRESLISGNMIQEGSTRQEAEVNIDMLLSLVDLIDHLELSVGSDQGPTRGRLQLKLDLP